MSNTKVLDDLFAVVLERKNAPADASYTASLYKKGRKKIAQKVGEEAVETALAGVLDNKAEVITESADLLYHLSVLWADCGVEPNEVYAELAGRFGLSGLEEKASRKG